MPCFKLVPRPACCPVLQARQRQSAAGDFSFSCSSARHRLRAWCKTPRRDSAFEAASDAAAGNRDAFTCRPRRRPSEPVRPDMSERPHRRRGGEREEHWDPAHFTWDPYEAKAEPRSGEVAGEAQRSGGSGGASGARRRGAAEIGDAAEEAAAPGASPGMEDVPSLDPSYDLSGVQKKSVPLVCQARAAASPPKR